MDEPSNEYIALLRSLLVHQYFGVFVATCFVYDFVTSLGDEIQFVWSSHFGLADVLFLAIRYSAIPEICLYMLFYFGGLNDRACTAVAAYLSFSFGIGMLLSQGIVALRTWALWNGSHRLQVACILGGGAFGAVLVYLNVAWIRGTQFPAVPHLHSCSVVSPYRPVAAAWILLAIADASLLVLTAIQGRSHLRRDSPRLVRLLYRDAFVFFFLTLLCSIATLLVGMLGTERYQSLLIGNVQHPPSDESLSREPHRFERIFNTVLACRVVVNLRAAARGNDLRVTIDFTETAAVFVRRPHAVDD